jgi:GT2 family glycosyltransferase
MYDRCNMDNIGRRVKTDTRFLLLPGFTHSIEAENLIELETDHYFTEFDNAQYALGDITVDIIIPVYNGYEFLEKLFESVEQNTTSPYRLIVVNDCSPDERVKPFLIERLKNHPDAIFIDHEENQGFLKSVNEAYTYVSNHFVLLNTDTEVPLYWLERLMFPIIHMENVASTTPFTNSGEIASFPNFVADNDIFEAMEVNALDSVFRTINPKEFYTEVPTGVGFCMGVNYTLAQKIGMFAQDTFGKGYGEENDWCQRAIQQGYRNLIVPNLFVYHKHGGSFSSDEKKALIQENITKLLERHPNYEKDVHAYISQDPHHTLRKLLVLLASAKNRPLHLIVDHDLGGGANIYADQLVESYMKEEKNVLLVRYDFYTKSFKLFHRYKSYSFACKIMSITELQLLLEKLEVTELFLNSLVSFKDGDTLLAYIHTYIEEKKAKLTLPMHDFYTVCPSYTLLNEEGKYCDVPSLEKCRSCMQSNMQEWRNFFDGTVHMTHWRESWSKLLHQSDTVLCFSNSSKEILLKAYPTLNETAINVVPHKVDAIEPVTFEKEPTSTLTVGILGAINYAKGAQIIKQLVQTIGRDKLDINVVVIGEITEVIRSDRFTSTGRYKHEALPDIIREHQIDIFLIPSIWPETFSYTSQEIMMMELPIMVFDLGAPAERVAHYEKGYIIEDVSAESVIDTLQLFQANR